MKRLLGLGTILVTVAGARSAMNVGTRAAESGSMLLIGVGLLIGAVFMRQHNRTRG